MTVSNVGTAMAADSQLTLYFSTDATASPDDHQVPRQADVSSLEPGAERCYGWGVFLPPDKRDYYYAAVGAVPNETSLDNKRVRRRRGTTRVFGVFDRPMHRFLNCRALSS